MNRIEIKKKVSDLLQQGSTPMIGLDIGLTHVRAAVLAKDESGEVAVQKVMTQVMPAGVSGEGGAINAEALQIVLRALIDKLSVKQKDVAFAIPSSAVVEHKLYLPDIMTERDIEEHVSVEAAQFLPFPTEEAAIDFAPYPSQSVEEDKIAVLVAAVRKDMIEDRLAAIEGCNLDAVVVDTEAYSIKRAVEFYFSESIANQKCYAIVDVSGSKTSITVIRDGETVFVRDAEIGSNVLIEQFVQLYDMKPEDAESKRMAVWRGEREDDTGLIEVHKGTLSTEINHALMLFATSPHYTQIEGVYLVGSGAAVRGLDHDLAVLTGTSVKNIPGDPAYALATGLALRSFQETVGNFPVLNFLPHREKTRKHQKKLFGFFSGASLLVGALIVLLGHLIIGAEIYRQEARVSRIESEIKKADAQLGDLKKLKEQTNDILARKNIVESLQEVRADATVMFTELSRIVPDGLMIKSIKQDGVHVEVIGYAQSNALVSNFMRAIDESPYWENPSVIEIKSGSAKTNEFNLKFDITRHTNAAVSEKDKGDKK